VRKAFDLSIDRESMMSSIAGDGNADLRTGPLNQGFVEWARSDADIKKDVVFDLKQAKELLTQAGHDTIATQLLGNNDTEQAWITWALNQGKKSCITINPDVVERTVYLTAQTQHKWNYGQVYSTRAYPDPDDYLYPLFVTGQSKNYGDVSDPTLDELITKQRQEFDHEKRKAILQEIDARWNKDFNYHTFSYTSKRVDGVSKRFSNYVPRPYDYTGVRYAWVS
jgi:ABC-type transport system substrate-binding protein